MELFPFRALRFHRPTAGHLEELVSPPYDVIGAEARTELARRNRHNIVHLTLPTGGAERYRTAAARPQRWCADGILRPDALPALYPAEQRFRIGAGAERLRTGFFAMLGLGDPAGRAVLAHEATFKGPRRDRTRILAACRADLEPILMLYSDPDGRVSRILRRSMRRRALASIREPMGSWCRMWRLNDPEAIGSVQRALRRREVLIADGHHRFASAVDVWSRSGRNDRSRPGILAFLCRVEDAAVASLPTHRVVRGLSRQRFDRLLPALRRRYRVEVLPAGTGAAEGRARRRMERLLGTDREGISGFGLRRRGDADGYLIRFAGGAAGRRTDVERLEQEVIGPILGLPANAAARPGRVAYLRDTDAAHDAVRYGDVQVAFLLGPIPARRVLSIARGGRLLPQKSTYFFPKLSSGLVLRRFED